ncbi:hypothetical protein [Brevibacterium sp. 'Marine']|uniref:hypothetical protein n=1 Tax=Brevibacterium sp. 'Marine' TaxID=2725563 RepID=UPI00145ED277|nr:hypothetical protein [Brevibacterium sp. 'Marine']
MRTVAQHHRERASGVEDTLSFNLPTAAMEVVPGIRVTASVSSKSYIACFSFEGPGVRVESAEETPIGLYWSKTLNSPFQYFSEIEFEPSESYQIVYLKKFRPPLGANKIKIKILPWSQSAGSTLSPFSGVILETNILDRPAIIMPEEVDHFGNF